MKKILWPFLVIILAGCQSPLSREQVARQVMLPGQTAVQYPLYADLVREPSPAHPAGAWAFRNIYRTPQAVALDSLMPVVAPAAASFPANLSASEYVQAIRQAREVEGLDQRLPLLTRRHDDLATRHARVLAQGRQRIAAVDRQRIAAVERWRESMQKLAIDRVPLRLKNLSGWPDSRLPTGLESRISYRVINEPAWLMAPHQRDFDVKLDALLSGARPAETITEMERRLSGAEQWFAEAEALYLADVQDYVNSVERWMAQLDRQAAQVSVTAQPLRDSFVRWQVEGLEDFRFTLQGDGQNDRECLCVTVRALHLEGLMPSNLELHDEVLDLRWQPGLMEIRNTSRAPVTVVSLAFVVDGVRLPVEGLDFLRFRPIEVKDSLSLDGWRMRPVLPVVTLTKAEAAAAWREFGIEVVYRSPADPAEHVLSRSGRYRLLDLAEQ